MKLSLITPVAFVNYTQILPGYFCIANVALAHKKYRDYFKDRPDVILDNGVFEEAGMTDQALLELAKEIQPKVMIAPDILNGSPTENWERGQEFATKYEAITVSDLMYVPQCKKGDTDGFHTQIGRIIREDTPYSWIGICRDAVYNAYGEWTGTIDQEVNRLYFGTELIRKGQVEQLQAKGIKIHYLGMGNNIPLIRHHWFVESMDTASLFWATMQQLKVNSYDYINWSPKRPKDYFELTSSYPLVESQKEFEQALRANCRSAQFYAQMASRFRAQRFVERI